MTTGFRVGQTFQKVLVEDLKRTQLVQYAGASGDFNPLHTDEVHARDVAAFPGVFAHGMLTMAMSGTLMSDVVGIANVRRFGGRFLAQVWPGQTLTAHLEVTEVARNAHGDTRVEFALRTRNEHGHDVFRGTATAVLERVPPA